MILQDQLIDFLQVVSGIDSSQEIVLKMLFPSFLAHFDGRFRCLVQKSDLEGGPSECDEFEVLRELICCWTLIADR